MSIIHGRTIGLALLLVLLTAAMPLVVPEAHAADFLAFDFESGLQGWTATAASQQQTLSFERENATTYQGKYALNFTSSFSANQPQTVAWVHNATGQTGIFQFTTGTKLDFAWNVPVGGALYVGLAIQLTDGRNITYISGEVGDLANSTSFTVFVLDQPTGQWINHERNVYQDYAAAWGPPASSVGINALALVHSYPPTAISATQVSYYDAIFLYSPTPEFVLSAAPVSAVVVIGGSREYRIDVDSVEGFSGTVTLSVSSVSSNVTWQLSQTQVDISPAQNASATLTATTNQNTTLRSYGVQVTANSGQLARSLTVTLTVARPSLLVNLSTDKLHYSQGGNVSASGHVQAFSGEPIGNASIYVEVVNPDGDTTHSANLATDPGGAFNDNFSIPMTAENGTYALYVLVSKVGFDDAFGGTNFVVGQTNTPAIVLTVLRSTDQENNTKTQFRLGETAMVWVSVVNAGAAMNRSMLWFTVDDPNGVSVLVTVQIGPLAAGESDVRGFSFQVGMTSATGVYHVTILVTNNFIPLGGTILDSAESTFIVTQ